MEKLSTAQYSLCITDYHFHAGDGTPDGTDGPEAQAVPLLKAIRSKPDAPCPVIVFASRTDVEKRKREVRECADCAALPQPKAEFARDRMRVY